jgi:hypothetical protein
MQLDQILGAYRTPQALREYAAGIKRDSLARWVDSTASPDRKNHAQNLRGEILCILATIREQTSELEQLPLGGDRVLALLIQRLAQTSRGHLGVELNALQGVLDLLDEVVQTEVTNGTEDARANSLIALADHLVADIRASVEFNQRKPAVARTLELIRAALPSDRVEA